MTSATTNIALQNQTTSSTVYAYISGNAIDNGNSLFLLQSDGKTPYYPSNPNTTGSPLEKDCAIALGAPGNTVTVTVPHLAGSRIWFSVDNTLTFLLNPANGSTPVGLVEPAVINSSDPNINTSWDFCEFTYNSSQIFVNISYVDFVSLPISLTLTDTSNNTQHVAGLPPNGLDTICSGLTAQQATDNAGWSSLVVKSPNGSNLRALSPTQGITINNNLFSGYYDSYVNQVWNNYISHPLSIDTQASFGVVTGQVDPNTGLMGFSGSATYGKPSASDIFSCSTGPFINNGNIEQGAITARFSAAFNRSTLMTNETQPSGSPSSYYQISPTNHYARIVHAANIGGVGYAFPYDDVTPDGGDNQSGSVFSGNPQLLTVAVGGGNVSTGLTTQE